MNAKPTDATSSRKNPHLATDISPDWGDLQVFLHAARQGTLSAAATSLGVNASTVQRRIGKLENSLQTRLFDRSQQGYSLTAAGEMLLQHALIVEAEMLAVGRKVGGRDQALSGMVRLATVDDLATDVLPPILKALRRAQPQLGVDLFVQSEFANLARQEADVAIRFGGKPQEPDVVAKRITQVDVALYASKGYLNERGRPQSLEQIGEHDIVRGDPRLAAFEMEKLMHRFADPAKTALRSNSMLSRYTAIRAGLGIGFIGPFMGERDSQLERLPFGYLQASAELWMLVHVDLRTNARVRAFVDFVYERMVAERRRFTRG